ncbi:DUF2334 domain-containing protein [Natrinema halophilum]|uniref:DUF2334 domain-containing protein n=1 Tax=Natrinema halophilum TaxID=1699371 RepID=A0A7D5GIY9_9EURY|nr:DUF2334 domain-containing protein [Natrinema halophilum]QLG47412.1 DUF2334 domain-containing protein [Natrinema halophilum]
MDRRRSVLLVIAVSVLLVSSVVVPAFPMYHLPHHHSYELSEGAEYRSVVVFRNDDIEPGHSDDLRRSVNQVFIDEEVPVTNAVIPTKNGESIAANESFCRNLRRQSRANPGLIEYSLHGYRHEPNDEGAPRTNGSQSTVRSEFGGLPMDEQRERIHEGKRIMTACLNTTPRSFVPPYATYDNATVDALAAENFSIVAGGGWFTESYYGRTDPFETASVVHLPEDQGFVENWDTNAFHNPRTLRSQFENAYRNGEVYVQGLHYWTFDSERRLEHLRAFIRYVKRHDDVLFLTLEEFADAKRDGRLTETGNGWSYTSTDDQRVYDTDR